MKKKSKVIDVDEFFKLLEMLTSIDEDKEMALAILEASNYQDREVIDKLLAKAMVFEDRFWVEKSQKSSYEQKTSYGRVLGCRGTRAASSIRGESCGKVHHLK